MSERARFLKKALRCMEEKDGTGLHDLAIDLDADAYYSQLEAFTEEDNRILNELWTQLNRDKGNRLASERTRLNGTTGRNSAEIMVKYCARLSPNAKRFLTAGISALDESRTTNADAEPASDTQQSDALDCHYASELLEKLGTVVERAARLERLPVGSAPNGAVQRYFQEAHDCYLYGFNTACVVLCRAILEAALQHTIPPKDREGKSVVGQVHIAQQKGLLSRERASWAEEIYTAGNLAIHNYPKFERQYQPGKLEELFWKARAVVESLYKG